MGEDKFDYFIEQTNGKLRELDSFMRAEFANVRKDIRDLDRFQWKQTGIYVAISVMAGGIGSFLIAMIERGGK